MSAWWVLNIAVVLIAVLSSPAAGADTMKSYKHYDLILGGYVCVLLCSNIIGAAKVSTLQLPLVGSVTFMAGVLFFPISYIFGDILTEVYGYARDRRCVWAGFAALVFAVVHGLRDRAPAAREDSGDKQAAVRRFSATRRASSPPR